MDEAFTNRPPHVHDCHHCPKLSLDSSLKRLDSIWLLSNPLERDTTTDKGDGGWVSMPVHVTWVSMPVHDSNFPSARHLVKARTDTHRGP
ncbi:hypothetical protein TNCV_3440661 [Trichonephila clavipes]|uniref:Uncharacterized protein n=1 Tax=Trichonephila clavipes TaxID=2585209 RepID=A0A8X7BFI3_TRICX|nr:hypothetical protein TNCV_3440661 [Trichonephila clavipes]